MCEHVCIFITCYNLPYSSKIKQSPLQQNPVYNRKPWEGSLHVWPVKAPTPCPQGTFAECHFGLAPRNVAPNSLQPAGRTALHWFSPVPMCSTNLLCHTSLHSSWLLLGMEDPPVTKCGAPGDRQLMMAGHWAHSCVSCSSILSL